MVASAQADTLARQLAQECCLFFSPGSRASNLGLQKANDALALAQPQFSSTFETLRNEAATLFKQAAQHWHSAPLVSGRLLHKEAKENYEQITFRAKKSGSPLAKAVDALMQLEHVSGVVDDCLRTATNFRRSREGPSAKVFVSSEPYNLNWERNRYQP